MSEAGSVCLSCLEAYNIFNIFDTHECEGIEEVYAEMLKACFDISISNDSSVNGMCENCILSLRKAYYFKQNVIENIKVLENESCKIEYKHSISNDYLQENTDIEEEKYTIDPVTGEFWSGYESNRENNENVDDENEETYEIIEQPADDEDEEDKSEVKHILLTDEYSLKKEKKTKSKTKAKNKNANLTAAAHSEKEGIEVTKYVCDHCEKEFYSKAAIDRHLKTHLNGPFNCQHCDQVFTKLNSRNCHMWRVHHTRLPYLCAQCGDRFPTFHQRLQHLKSAHGETTKYPCPYCDNTYYYAGARSKHIRSTHLRVHNHPCTYCKMAFFKRRDLTSHLGTAHGIGEQKYFCGFCNKGFYKKSVLLNHIKKIHMKKLTEGKMHKIKCDLCPAKFDLNSELLHHMKSHEPYEGSTLTIIECIEDNVGVENIKEETSNCNNAVYLLGK